MIYLQTELSHHGIKGMKWGVRKQENIAKKRGYTRNYLGGASEPGKHVLKHDPKDKQTYKRIKRQGGLYEKQTATKVKNGYAYTKSYMTKNGDKVSYKDAQAYLRVVDTNILRSAVGTWAGIYGGVLATAVIATALHK